MKAIKLTLRLIFLSLSLYLSSMMSRAQDTNDFKTTIVDKQVKEFPERYSKTTPIETFISVINIMANGKMGMLRAYSTSRSTQSLPKENTPNKEVTEEYKNSILNWKIKEYITYKDSTAAVISTINNEQSFHLILYFNKENGEWLAAGEDQKVTLDDAKKQVKDHLPILTSYTRMVERLKQTPKDTINFIKYIKEYSKEPKIYILEKLAKHRVVIYGEVHRRNVSWDLLRQIIADPRFAETTGTVFMEFASYNQKEWDRFYTQDELDLSLLLNIFSCQQFGGWTDKGQFDFMVALRELNKKLPTDKKIRVIFADEQIPLASIASKEEFLNKFKNSKDRNTQMADIIQQTMQSTTDKRNSLFIVGFGHGYKSHVAGTHSTPSGQVPALSAGAQLVERFSDDDVFSIFPHCISISNSGVFGGRIRNGLFDYVFQQNGNIPIAFDLNNSPLGEEPFDGMVPMKFDPRVGNYSNNYDGYLFFGKLEDEEKSEPLLELFTDDFVNELKRQAHVIGVPYLYNISIEDLTREHIISILKKQTIGKLWYFGEE